MFGLGVGTTFGGGGNSDPAKAENTTGTFQVDIPAGDTEILADETISILDNDGTVLSTYSNPLYEDIEIEVFGDEKSGIQYKRPLPTGQTTSYATYDDAWRLVNNPYPSDPTNPEYCQELVNFYTLKYDNEFGNRLRFTDASGNFTVTSDNTQAPNTSYRYIVDNLTGLGIGYTATSSNVVEFRTFSNILTYCEAANDYGYSDWYCPNTNELNSFTTNENSFNGVVIPFMLPGSRGLITSSTYPSDSSKTIYISTLAEERSLAKTIPAYFFLIRNHF